MQFTHEEIEQLQERVGNGFLYFAMVIGDQADKARSQAIRAHGLEYMRLLWNNHLTLNQKYHMALLAKVNMFSSKSAAMGFVTHQWEDMAQETRAKIFKDCLARLDLFEKALADADAANRLGLFDRGEAA